MEAGTRRAAVAVQRVRADVRQTGREGYSPLRGKPHFAVEDGKSHSHRIFLSYLSFLLGHPLRSTRSLRQWVENDQPFVTLYSRNCGYYFITRWKWFFLLTGGWFLYFICLFWYFLYIYEPQDDYLASVWLLMDVYPITAYKESPNLSVC